MNESLATATLPTIVGALTVVASDAGLRAVLWQVDPPGRVPLGPAVPDADHPVVTMAVEQLGEYFAGTRRAFDLPLDLRGTAFQLKAWHTLATIAYGETISYAEQAERMGDRSKARAVGVANGRNPVSIVLPCHRVVGSDGSLTGFAAGLDTKRALLDHEARVAGTRLV